LFTEQLTAELEQLTGTTCEVRSLFLALPPLPHPTNANHLVLILFVMSYFMHSNN